MLHKNNMIYGLLILFVGFAMSFSTATAQVTGEDMESQAQNAFTGIVVDASNGQPIANATVKVEGTDKETTTDENGRFTLENLAASGEQGMEGMEQGMEGAAQGGVTLVISADGYQELSESIQPQAQAQEGGQAVQSEPQTFELEPKQGQGQ